MGWAICFGRIGECLLSSIFYRDILTEPPVRPTMDRSREFVADTREGVKWLLEMRRRQKK